MAQDVALSRRKQGFDSPRERQNSSNNNVLVVKFGEKTPIDAQGVSKLVPKPASDPPNPEMQTAAPAATGNGGEGVANVWSNCAYDHLTIARLDQLSSEIEPDENGSFPSAILWVIRLADEILPDCDLEPSLGWQDMRGVFADFKFRKTSTDYLIRYCLDLEMEPEHDEDDGCGEPDADREYSEQPVHLNGGGAA